jgi:CheY-like chemotaxis protein
MRSVLFVSHDRDLREVAVRVLRSAGWEVTAVSHGGHALLACVEGRTFDVLAVEDWIPEETGAQLARCLRRYCPDLQIVRMQDHVTAGADGITVVRPFTADDLIDAVLRAAATAVATV